MAYSSGLRHYRQCPCKCNLIHYGGKGHGQTMEREEELEEVEIMCGLILCGPRVVRLTSAFQRYPFFLLTIADNLSLYRVSVAYLFIPLLISLSLLVAPLHRSCFVCMP